MRPFSELSTTIHPASMQNLTADYAETFRITGRRPTLSGIPSQITPPQSSFPSTPGMRAHQPNASPSTGSALPKSSRTLRPAQRRRDLRQPRRTDGETFGSPAQQRQDATPRPTAAGPSAAPPNCGRTLRPAQLQRDLRQPCPTAAGRYALPNCGGTFGSPAQLKAAVRPAEGLATGDGLTGDLRQALASLCRRHCGLAPDCQKSQGLTPSLFYV
jgi:hypothetical protein